MTYTAWALIGFPDCTDPNNGEYGSFEGVLVRVAGGHATYEAVSFEDSGRATKVKLERLTASDGLGVVRRYVDPGTQLEIVRAEA